MSNIGLKRSECVKWPLVNIQQNSASHWFQTFGSLCCLCVASRYFFWLYTNLLVKHALVYLFPVIASIAIYLCHDGVRMYKSARWISCEVPGMIQENRIPLYVKYTFTFQNNVYNQLIVVFRANHYSNQMDTNDTFRWCGRNNVLYSTPVSCIAVAIIIGADLFCNVFQISYQIVQW